MEFELRVPEIPAVADSDPLDETIGDAIQTVFSSVEEVVLVWNGVRVGLSLKYDVGEMWRDILLMLKHLKAEEGQFTVHWPSNSFFVQWDFTLNDEMLRIESHWMAVSGGSQSLAELKHVDNVVEIDKQSFVSQWHKLLITIRDSLLAAGYAPARLYGFEDLMKELEQQ
jgi:hypothetical protein